MKQTIIIFILINFLGISLCAQEKNDEKDFKHHFQIDVGGFYRAYMGNKHIVFSPIDTTKDPNIETYNRYGGFNKKNYFSFDISSLYQFDILPHFFISTGIGFVNHKEIYNSSPDTVLHYHTLYPYHQTIITYSNSIYCFYIPVYVGYKYKFFSIKAGIDVDFWRIYSFRRTNINGENYKGSYYGYKYYWDNYKTIYPCLIMDFKCWNISDNINLELSPEVRMITINAYDFLLKINLKFNLKCKK
jgi:hypothetical protein